MAAFRGNGRHGVEGMRNFFVVITLRLPYHGRAYYYMAYDENSIKTLDWREHIRMRPGMYIGKLGDGTSPDDGVYVLLKEVIDNSIDEFVMGFGKKITIDVTPDGLCEVRDFGRGIPLGKLLDCAAKINTGAKYDSDAFKKSVGLNGVGTVSYTHLTLPTT